MIDIIEKPDWAPESDPHGPLVWWDALSEEQKQVVSQLYCEYVERLYKRQRQPTALVDSLEHH